MTSAVGSANASRGLEVAVANLQEYCNGQFPSSFSIEILLVCDDELLFFVQNWRIDCWLGLTLHHRDGSCLQWQNVLKYCHRYAFMQGTRFYVMLRMFRWTKRLQCSTISCTP